MKRSLNWWLFAATLLMSLWTTYVWNNNTYLEEQNVPVTFIDKYTTQSCVKGHCSDRYMGLFKTTDGIIFDRHISDYMFRQMHVGERFSLTLRPMDIRQTTKDNICWLLAPIIIYTLTVFLWLFALIVLSEMWTKRKK